MKKVELLAPAGNMASFKAAIQNGADAVFLGGKMFGARASAANFTMEEIHEAVQLAHCYGVKVHVTLNTLIKENECEECMQYVDELVQANVDALIIQDLGIMSLIRQKYPNLELHASTQMHIHNCEGLKNVKKWGLKRVVVARETPLELIRKMCQEDIEIEVFVQGAYCVSYSGQCQMSQNIGGRSGNRGECAQACRLPYTLIKKTPQGKIKIDTKGQYLLSLKDLNALKLVPELIEAGVASFKIEGRMKRPEYVAMMTSIYRQAIDSYYAHQPFDVNAKVKEEMQKVFNRGFTEGYLNHINGQELTSAVRPNHQGIVIGKVKALSKDKMSIALHHELNQKDGIRILNDKEDKGFVVNYMYCKGQLINHAENEVIELDRVKGVKVNDIVVKTSDYRQLERLKQTIEENKRKVYLTGEVICHLNEPLVIRVSDAEGFVSECISEQRTEKAQKTPLDAQRIETQMKKTGNTPFLFEKLHIDLDENVIFPLSLLNELRREVLSKHASLRSHRPRTTPAVPFELPNIQPPLTHDWHVSVSTYEQYQVAKQYNCKIDILSRKLYDQIHALDEQAEFIYPRVYHQAYDVKGIASELGGLGKMERLNASLNCFNAACVHFLYAFNAKCITLNDELSDAAIEDLMQSYQRQYHSLPNVEKIIYERKENMIMEYCPINTFIHDTKKKNCQLCHTSSYYLKDIKGKEYPLLGDDECRMHVYHSEVCNEIQKLPFYQKMGITNYRLIFTFENEEETRQICEQVLNHEDHHFSS